MMSVLLTGPPENKPPARMFEWLMGAAMIGMAGQLFYTPESLTQSLFKQVVSVGIGPYAMATILGMTGLARLISLYLNGRWVPSPKVRFACCLIGALVWLHMGVALIAARVEYVSLSVYVFAALTAGEVLSCYRASYDARHHSD